MLLCFVLCPGVRAAFLCLFSIAISLMFGPILRLNRDSAAVCFSAYYSANASSSVRIPGPRARARSIAFERFGESLVTYNTTIRYLVCEKANDPTTTCISYSCREASFRAFLLRKLRMQQTSNEALGLSLVQLRRIPREKVHIREHTQLMQQRLVRGNPIQQTPVFKHIDREINHALKIQVEAEEVVARFGIQFTHRQSTTAFANSTWTSKRVMEVRWRKEHSALLNESDDTYPGWPSTSSNTMVWRQQEGEEASAESNATFRSGSNRVSV